MRCEKGKRDLHLHFILFLSLEKPTSSPSFSRVGKLGVQRQQIGNNPSKQLTTMIPRGVSSPDSRQSCKLRVCVRLIDPEQKSQPVTHARRRRRRQNMSHLHKERSGGRASFFASAFSHPSASSSQSASHRIALHCIALRRIRLDPAAVGSATF
jgi:hypothetical protein